MNQENKVSPWTEVKRKIKAKFEKFNDIELESFNGHLDQLSEKVQKRYGYDKIKADQECKEFIKAS